MEQEDGAEMNIPSWMCIGAEALALAVILKLIFLDDGWLETKRLVKSLLQILCESLHQAMYITVLGKPDRNYYSAPCRLGNGQGIGTLSLQKQTVQ